MKTKWFLVVLVCTCLLSVMGGGVVPALAQGPDTPIGAGPQSVVGAGFTYQGQLKQGSAPFSGNCDFQFTLWDNATAGSQVTTAVSKLNVAVSRGVFTAPDISFGVSSNPAYQSFSGEARWLQIAARCPAGSGTYTTLAPRQALTATPYALSLRPGAQIVGDVFDAPLFKSVLRLENTSATAGLDGADALNAFTHSDWGAAVRATGEKGYGGVFTSYAGFALVTHGPSLIDNRTPQQIGMLRWYDANTSLPSVTVGQWCDQLAFDGEHMWVTVWAEDKVVKIRASDMAIIGSYPAGSRPNPIIFDGDEIWVGSETTGQITKIRASDGSSAGSFSTGASGHWGMAFDGANVWVTNKDTDNVTKIRASDNAILGTYPVGDTPTGIAFDGTNVWVANSNSGTVTKLKAADGSRVGHLHRRYKSERRRFRRRQHLGGERRFGDRQRAASLRWLDGARLYGQRRAHVAGLGWLPHVGDALSRTGHHHPVDIRLRDRLRAEADLQNGQPPDRHRVRRGQHLGGRYLQLQRFQALKQEGAP